jgi:hypothetical protein
MFPEINSELEHIRVPNAQSRKCRISITNVQAQKRLPTATGQKDYSAVGLQL